MSGDARTQHELHCAKALGTVALPSNGLIAAWNEQSMNSKHVTETLPNCPIICVDCLLRNERLHRLLRLAVVQDTNKNVNICCLAKILREENLQQLHFLKMLQGISDQKGKMWGQRFVHTLPVTGTWNKKGRLAVRLFSVHAVLEANNFSKLQWGNKYLKMFGTSLR